MNDEDTRAPEPLPEPRRRAYLEAMGIPLWLPRRASAGSAEADAGEAAAMPPGVSSVAPDRRPAPAASSEPAVAASAAEGSAEGPTPAAGPAPAEEPPPIPAELADALALRTEPSEETEPETAGEGGSAADPARMDWDPLNDAIVACTRCPLCETRRQAVPGVGSRSADLLVIGEAPGQEEDQRGEPFVGRAGQLLDRMLAAIGLERDSVFITNVLKCRPPENRDPRPQEIHACAPYLQRQIELISPRVILSVGRVSAQSLLATDQRLGSLRGQWHRFGPQDTPLLVTYHPAYLLRKPAEKRKSWSDLKAVRDCLRD